MQIFLHFLLEFKILLKFVLFSFFFIDSLKFFTTAATVILLKNELLSRFQQRIAFLLWKGIINVWIVQWFKLFVINSTYFSMTFFLFFLLDFCIIIVCACHWLSSQSILLKGFFWSVLWKLLLASCDKRF